MKKILITVVILSMMLTVAGCGNDKDASSDKISGAATNVTVEEVKVDSISETAEYTGEVKASESVSISSKISATAETVNVEVGDFVNEGDVLLIMDDTDYRIQYNQAQAVYNQALAQYNSITNGTAQQTTLQLEASLNSAKIEFNNAKTNYENHKVLYESGAVSKSAYDTAYTRYENAQLNLNTAQSNFDLSTGVVLNENKAAAKASVDSAKVQVEAAQNALDNTVIYAPISGYVAARNTNEGQIVAPGVEIFSIKATDVVDIEVNVTESVISDLEIGDEACVNVKSVNDEKITGTISNIAATKDSYTGMYKVVVKVDGINTELKDGMIADVALTLDNNAKAKVIPSEALMEDSEGKKYVYIAVSGKAERKNVETGISSDTMTEVVSGLKKGDKVIVSGKEYISEKNNDIKIVD